MSITSKAILDGNIDPMTLSLFLKSNYQADCIRVELTHSPNYFIIGFRQRCTLAERKLRPVMRQKLERSLSVFIHGMCMEDYADVTTNPATLVTIGSAGHAKEILIRLCNAYGGWFECGYEDGWTRIDAGCAGDLIEKLETENLETENLEPIPVMVSALIGEQLQKQPNHEFKL